MRKIKTMNNDYLVYENGELKPKYTIRDKNTKQTVATASNIEIALRIVKIYIENNRKGLEIFDEAKKEVFKVNYDLL